MLHLYTHEDKIPDNLKVIKDVESAFKFEVMTTPLGTIPFNDEISNIIIKQIDKVIERHGRGIVTLFGETTIQEVSTGCKAALMAATHSNYCISNIEIGQNVIPVLLSLSDSIDSHILALNNIEALSDKIVALDGEQMQLSEAITKIDKVIDAKYEAEYEKYRTEL